MCLCCSPRVSFPHSWCGHAVAMKFQKLHHSINLIHQLSSIYGPDTSPSCPHVAHPHLIPTHIYSCPIPIGPSPIHWSTFSQLVARLQKLGLIAGLLQLGHGGPGDLHLPQICQVLRTESRGQWPGTVQHQLRVRSLGRNADLTWE